MATIGVPTLCMILLFLLPFYDRSPERRPERRPIATITGICVICAMAYLTYSGASAGSPNRIEYRHADRPSTQAGGTRWPNSKRAGRWWRSPAAWPATRLGDNGNDGPGPPLTHIGARLPRQAIARTLRQPDGADAVVQEPTGEEVRSDRQLPLAAQVAGAVPARVGTAPAGSEAGEVRAMFDRIAGVYDLLNTVMTAGLHHRWRARAADLARRRARAAACSTSRPVRAIWRSSSRGASRRAARSWAATSPRAMLDARAREGRRQRAARAPRFEWADAIDAALSRTTASTRRPSASARATSTTSRAGWRRWRASCARAGGSSCSRSRRPTRRRCRSSTRCGSIASCLRSAAWGALAARSHGRGGAGEGTIAQAYTYLPDSVKRFPGPAQLAAEMAARGLDGHRLRDHRRRHRRDPRRHRVPTSGHHERGEQHGGAASRRRRGCGSTRSCAAAARACGADGRGPSAPRGGDRRWRARPRRAPR